ncbi:MAG: tetratricopeptide repeat protein [Bryobacteraceae bacterium]
MPVRCFFRACGRAAPVLALCCSFFNPSRLSAQDFSALYKQVLHLSEIGRYPDAERLIDTHLSQHASDPAGLGIKALVLDFEGRYQEAERDYQRALDLAPDSLFVLNNLGRHYVALKRPAEARATFQKVLAQDRSNWFALQELAKLSVDGGSGREALGYLDRTAGSQPETQLLRARALHLTGDDVAASKLLDAMRIEGVGRAELYFRAGLLLAEWHHYLEAQSAFLRALEAAPADANIQYNLGLASAEAGDLNRARDIFERALKRRPDDVDCMLHLALVYQNQGDYERSLPVLIRASGLAPKRPEILRNIAFAAEKLGMYGDTAQAWDRYLELQPGDEVARRERGFALASANDLQRGLADLTWYHRKHPEDVDGLYELAVAEGVAQPDDALDHLNLAIRQKPEFVAARYARASLQYAQGRPEQARDDIAAVLSAAPTNMRALDLFGRVELQTNHPGKALGLFARGLKTAPEDAQLLLHYSQALQALNRPEEAQQFAARFRAANRRRGQPASESWAFSFYERSPEEQRARYVAGLRGRIAETPDNASLHLSLGEMLLSEAGQKEEAVREFREAARLSSDPSVAARSGRALMTVGQARAAAEFLRVAAEAEAPSTALLYDLAAAEFLTSGLSTARATLARIPELKRDTEYHLTEAEILDAAGRPAEAVAALARARSAPIPENARPEFYMEWSSLLLLHEKPAEAFDVLQTAEKTFAGNRDLLLGRAFVHALRGTLGESMEILSKLRKQWPEWGRLHLVEGAILARRGDGDKALDELRAAGTTDPATAGVACYVATAILNGKPGDPGTLSQAAETLVKAEPGDAFCRLLAGTAAYATRNYDEALRNLQPAVAAHPRWKEGRTALQSVYAAMGRAEDAAREDAAAKEAVGASAPVLGGGLAAGLMGVRLRIPAAVSGAL